MLLACCAVGAATPLLHMLQEKWAEMLENRKGLVLQPVNWVRRLMQTSGAKWGRKVNELNHIAVICCEKELFTQHQKAEA